jgi:hypothetical protein
MERPARFFNVSYNFDLGEAANGGYPYRRIQVNNCFFMKRDGTFINSTEELNSYNGDLIIVRRDQQGNYAIPSIDNFDNYPELFDPNNPDADRNRGQNNGEDIGVNEPYKITDITRGEIEHFSGREIVAMTGGKRRKNTKRRKHTKRRKQSKRRKH